MRGGSSPRQHGTDGENALPGRWIEDASHAEASLHRIVPLRDWLKVPSRRNGGFPPCHGRFRSWGREVYGVTVDRPIRVQLCKEPEVGVMTAQDAGLSLAAN